MTPPTGAALELDILQNGASIFPVGITADLPDGQATEEDGNQFKSANLPVNLGDQFTVNVIQVGSTIPGSDGVLQLIVKY